MHFSGSWPVTLFWGTILAGGAQFSLRGAQAMVWGARPQNAPRGAEPGPYIAANPTVMQLSRRVLQKISHSEKLSVKCVVDFYIVDCFSVFWLLVRLKITWLYLHS